MARIPTMNDGAINEVEMNDSVIQELEEKLEDYEAEIEELEKELKQEKYKRTIPTVEEAIHRLSDEFRISPGEMYDTILGIVKEHRRRDGDLQFRASDMKIEYINPDNMLYKFKARNNRI
jgi:chromosome segregation ATPase